MASVASERHSRTWCGLSGLHDASECVVDNLCVVPWQHGSDVGCTVWVCLDRTEHCHASGTSCFTHRTAHLFVVE
jgi:hypothetical protein